jgi:predicted RecA/RadA family phage recombinase
MVNKVKDGKTLTWTATEAVGAGGLVSYCGKIGIAQAAIASGADGVLDLEGGVYNFPITAAGAVTKGAPVYLPSGKTVSSNGSDLTVTSAAGATIIGYNLTAVGTGGGTSLDVILV